MAQQQNMERITVQLTPEEKTAIEKNADLNGRSASAEMRMAAQAWLRAHSK